MYTKKYQIPFHNYQSLKEKINKGHSTYKGVNQTLLTRVKEVQNV